MDILCVLNKLHFNTSGKSRILFKAKANLSTAFDAIGVQRAW